MAGAVPKFPNQPGEKAAMRSTVGSTFRSTARSAASQPDIHVNFARTSSTWSRTYSAGDLVSLRRAPNRRHFDAAGHPEEIVNPSSTIDRLSTKRQSQSDPGNRCRLGRYANRSPSAGPLSPTSSMSSPHPHSPGGALGAGGFWGTHTVPADLPTPFGSQQDRALEFWHTGETCRIMNHIAPHKERHISLYGDSFKGFSRNDWSNVDHIKRVRDRFPMNRQKESIGPFPQGESCEEIIRNRCFAGSHGSSRLPCGMARVGGQVMVV